MNSASILMNVASPPATGAQSSDAEAGSSDGFTAALAAVQEDPAVQQAAGAKQSADAPSAQNPEAEDVSALAIIASLLMQGTVAAANDASEDAAPATAAESSPALSALGTAANPAATQASAAASAQTQDSAIAAAASRTAGARGGAKRDAQDALEAVSQSAGNDADGTGSNDRLLLDKLQDVFAAQPVAASNANPGVGAAASAAAVASASANAGPQSVAAAVHLATTVSRDGASDVTTTTHATIHEPVGSPRWAEAIGSRLVLMSMRGQQEGSLTLTPEHLGPMEVQISVNKETANVWFGAQHAETRAALTDAMPRLRELLAASGLSLGQSGVSEQTPRRAATDAMPGRPASGAGAEITAATEVATPAWRALRSGLIDTYA